MGKEIISRVFQRNGGQRERGRLAM